jgi:16S rRNA (adenine1518-N6/adenine1519-N6)-dimethyltransferase
VRILEGDILAQDIPALETSPYRVVGNIPYYLTGALAVHLLDQPHPPARIDLLVQREVAERLSAPPGGWSLATLGVRVYGRPELRLLVPAQSFLPPPRVASALLRIVPDPEPALPRAQLQAFFGFARPFFQARRKQLVQVASQMLGGNKEAARERLRALGIEPSRRPETLDLEEWKRLFVALANPGLRQ